MCSLVNILFDKQGNPCYFTNQGGKMKRCLLIVVLFLIGCASQYMTAGKVYMQQEEYKKAEEQFKQQLSQNPLDPDAWWWLGTAYVYEKEYEEACKCFDKIAEIVPEKKELKKDKPFLWSVYYDAGLQAQRNEDWGLAKKRFKKATEFEPDSSIAYVNLAWIFSKLGEEDTMIAYYNKAIELNPNNLEPYRNLGIYYIKAEKYNQAIDYFKQGLAIDSTDAHLLYRLGVCYFYKEDYPNAKNAFERVIRADSTLEDAYFNLGAILIKEKKYNEAVKVLSRAVTLRPDDIEALSHLGGVYLIMGEYKNAVDTYTKIIDLNPTNVDAYEGRANAYWKLGMKKEADADLNKAKELHKEK